MTRIEFIKEKRQVKLENLMAKQAESHKCGDCKFHLTRGVCPKAEYKSSQMNITACLPSDPACELFQPKHRSGKGRVSGNGCKEEWKLSLDSDVPETLTPCGFYEESQTLTESCWLPYQDENGNVKLRPSVIFAEKDKPPQILDFLEQDRIRGTFPSQDLTTLMSIGAVRKLTLKNYKVEPRIIDSEIDQAFNQHLDIPIPERILCKRWIEGTFFYDTFDAYPIQNILGISESGKSRLCLLNLALAYHAEGLIDPTEATIFRSKEEDRVSLIVDESEYLNDPRLYSTIRILINASYSKDSGYVSRYDEIDGKRVKRRFNLYSPMCISGIGGLEGVTLSRAFRIVMRRVKKDFPKAKPTSYKELRDNLYILRITRAFEVYDIYQKTDISNIVSARFEELFKPIFAMTKFMGLEEEWQILEKWCKEYEEGFRIENLNVHQEEVILTSLSKLVTEKKAVMPSWYQIKDIANLATAETGRQISSKQISSILYRLGLTQRKRVHGYTLVYAPEELLELCASRIGLHISELPTPQSLPTHPYEANKIWLEEALKKNE